MFSTSIFFCYGVHGSQRRDEAFVSLNYKLSTMSRYFFSPLRPSDSMGHVGEIYGVFVSAAALCHPD